MQFSMILFNKIVCLVLAFSSAMIAAQEVQVQISPDAPARNQPIYISLLIDYPNPREVALTMPDLSGIAHIDRIRTESRHIPDRNQPLTFIEITLIPYYAGTLDINAVKIILPGHSILTQTISLFVHGTAEMPTLPPVLVWEYVSDTVVVGERAELILRTTGNLPELLPENIFQSWKRLLSEQAICEYQRPGVVDREQGIVARLVLIPLTAGTITFAPVQFLFNDQTVTIPGLSVPVMPALSTDPSPRYDPPEPFSVGTEKTVVPRRSSIWYLFVVLVVAGLSGFVLFYRRHRVTAVLFWIAALCVCGYCVLTVPKNAAMRDSDVYRVPETGGAVSTHFDAGEIVIIRSAHGEWVSVESSDGRAGWVKASQVEMPER
jgi:hypothetical protein